MAILKGKQKEKKTFYIVAAQILRLGQNVNKILPRIISYPEVVGYSNRHPNENGELTDGKPDMKSEHAS
jgi:hypothetical protein